MTPARANLRAAQLLPKTELHVHLDGSLEPEFIIERSKRWNLEFQPQNASELSLHIDSLKSGNLCGHSAPGKNWPVFDYMNSFLQTAEDLVEATRRLCEDMWKRHVLHLEIRFCPSLHCEKGLSEQSVLQAVLQGFEEGCKSTSLLPAGWAADTRPADVSPSDPGPATGGIQGGIIVGALRSLPSPHLLNMARLAHAHLSSGVVAFDVCGAETYPLSLPPLQEALQYCQREGVPITIHCGELPEEPSVAGNLRLAAALPAHRIGHGLALAYGESSVDGTLLDLWKSQKPRIPVECCLTSNVAPHRVSSYEAHPVRSMYDAGIKVCINCDNTLSSGAHLRRPTPELELLRLVEEVGFSWAEAIDVLWNGARAAFVRRPDKRREWLAMFGASLQWSLCQLEKEGVVLGTVKTGHTTSGLR